MRQLSLVERLLASLAVSMAKARLACVHSLAIGHRLSGPGSRRSRCIGLCQSEVRAGVRCRCELHEQHAKEGKQRGGETS